MMYIQATSIIDGAVDEEFDFVGEDAADQLDAWLRDLEDSGHGIDVYVLHHDHEYGIECECVQYVSDHNPTYRF
jgi:hypothetical protein